MAPRHPRTSQGSVPPSCSLPRSSNRLPPPQPRSGVQDGGSPSTARSCTQLPSDSQSLQLLPTSPHCHGARRSPPSSPLTGSASSALHWQLPLPGHYSLRTPSLPAAASRAPPAPIRGAWCRGPRVPAEPPRGRAHSRCSEGGRAGPTCEEDDAVVSGALVHGVHALQLWWQPPPEALHLSWPQGHQLPVPCQPPEVPAWGRGVGRQVVPGVRAALPPKGACGPRGAHP